MTKKAPAAATFAIALVLLATIISALPTLADATWNIQVVDAKAKLDGISLALDSHDQPHMVYPATPSGNSFSNPAPYYLLYTSWNGSGWSTQTVDTNSYIEYSGLAFDSNDTPHIAYGTHNQSYVSATGKPSFPYLVKYATWNGTNWTITTIGSGVQGSIAIDSRGYPHIAYGEENGLLKYASWTGSSWAIQTADPDFLRPQKSTGEITAYQYLALDANDNPCIVYSSESTVKIAMGNSLGWDIQTVVSNEPLKLGNVAVDSHGYPQFTYVTTLDGSLFYERWNGSAWAAQRVDQAAGGFEGTFVKLDSRDTPHITYISYGPNQDFSVSYAVWTGTGWDIQMVAEFAWTANKAPAPFALDSQGNPHICYLTGRGTGDSHRFWADGTATYATRNVEDFTAAILVGLVAVAAVAVGALVLFKRRR